MAADRQAVTEIKARLNIADMVRRWVDLRRIGGRWMGPCPFHQETKPSFSVNEDEGFFYCFGCQAAGDVIDFYCRMNGLEFREGLAQLAEETGVALDKGPPRQVSAKDKADKDDRRVFLEMYTLANQHFQNNLADPVGEACRNYLSGRGLAADTLKDFGLGYSSGDWHALHNFLRAKGHSDEKSLASGLLSKNEKGHIYDRFRERLMFPIVNLSGQIIAFGARVITSGQDPKYLNSGDSLLYKKGDHLYGLFQARRAIAQQGRVLLTEGYMDVLALRQFGWAHACGVLGTALTPNQVKRLGGLCQVVEMVFDGDAAGFKAALRACVMVLTQGLKCRVVSLPQGEDIDSLLHKEGRGAFEALLAHAQDGFEYCVRHVSERFSPKEILDWARQFVKELKVPELLSFYLPRLCTGFGLDEKALRQGVAAGQTAGTQAPSARRSGTGAAQPGPINVSEKWEKEILHFAVRHPEHLSLLEGEGARELLRSEWAARLWAALAVAAEGASDLMSGLEGEEKRFYVQCLMQKTELDERAVEELEDIKRTLCQARQRRTKESSAAAVRQAQSGTLADDQLALLGALQATLGRNNE